MAQLVDCKRLAWVDFLKDLAIFIVVLGHFSYQDAYAGIKTSIYGFHMPLFFTLAGCTAAISFSRGASPLVFIKKRVVSVFLPYLVWSFLWGVPWATRQEIEHYDVIRHLHTFVCGDVMQWFLICLFVLQLTYAAYKYITQRMKHPAFKVMIACLLLILLYLLHRQWGRTSADVPYWTLEFFTNAYIFFLPFALGVFIIEHPTLFKRILQSKTALFSALMISLFCIRLYPDLPMISGNYGKLITGMSVTILLIKLTTHYDFLQRKNGMATSIIRQIILMGKYTMVIYLLHGAFLPSAALSATTWGMGIFPFMIMVVIAVVVCYICIALDCIISLSPLGALLLLGKPLRS